jgi:putative ABC transport system substrate-binding protein
MLGMAVIGLIVLGSPASARGGNIAFLTSDTLTSTQRAVSGARRLITRDHPDEAIHQFLLSPSAGGVQAVVDSIRGLKPKLILTVGSTATRFAQERFSEIPIVFSSVMYPTVSGFVDSPSRPGRNVTGASLDIPPDIQFRYFKKILPNLRRIGILFTDNTAPLIPASRRTARAMGLELVAIRVSSPKELPAAIDSLAGSVDGVWSLADPALFDPQSTKYILLNCLRRGLPVMGFSRHVVESGALFALDFDYKAIGRQAGRIACAIIDGADPSALAVSTPDIIWFHYNENTARHMSIAIPEELVAVAKEVYR